MKPDVFLLPPGVYLDGNSLGLMPHAARAAVTRRMDEWATRAVSGWDAWFGLAEALAPSVARLVGAGPHEVAVTGSITANLHALLATLYRPAGERRHLLATALDFPSDVYALQSWADRYGAEVRFVPSRDGHTIDEADVEAYLTDDVAVALLPTVLYRSGQLLDIPRLTCAAHERGVLIGWDAAHSAGSVPHDLHAWGVDFAVWCHYKYVNAGPGAPGGLFLHERHHDAVPGLRGWWGNHKETQFDMTHTYHKASGAGAYQQGTPPILALAALEGALEVFDEVGMSAIRTRSLELTSTFMREVDAHLPELRIVTPRENARRGGHVALAHPDAHLLSLGLRARGITPDFRAPDILRLAPVALYNDERDIEVTVQALRELLDAGNLAQYRALEQAVR